MNRSGGRAWRCSAAAKWAVVRARLAVVMMTGLLAAAPAVAARHTVMIVSWTGCEEACQAFQDELRSRGMDVRFLLRDAARQKSRLPGFVEEARHERVDLVLAYGTSVALGMAGARGDPSPPLPGVPKVFMIVADPVGAGVVASLDQPGRPDVTGTYNRVPERVNVETLRLYRPNFRRLGLLYHADERNSVVKRDELAALAQEMGFELIARELPAAADGRPRPSDIAPAVHALKQGGAEFLYIGSSSFLRDNADLLTQSAVAVGLPVLSPYESVVRDAQALLSVAARYADVGRLAARQAERILVGGVPAGQLPVARLSQFGIVVNMRVAKRLGMVPPLAILQVAETVN